MCGSVIVLSSFESFVLVLLHSLQSAYCISCLAFNPFLDEVGSVVGEGNGTPFRCSCLENPRDGGAWWAAVYGVAELDTTEVT